MILEINFKKGWSCFKSDGLDFSSKINYTIQVMLVLKLRRIGKKHQPAYRLVVTEKRTKLDGKYLDDLGWYNPRSKQHQFKKERVLHWLGHGAQKTDTVHNLLIKAGVIEGNKIAVHKIKTVGQSAENINEQGTKNMDEQMNPMPGQSPEGAPAMPETPVTEEPVTEEEESVTVPEEPAAEPKVE